MKRRIAIVLLLLVLGAMVNIAVAWVIPPDVSVLRHRLGTTKVVGDVARTANAYDSVGVTDYVVHWQALAPHPDRDPNEAVEWGRLPDSLLPRMFLRSPPTELEFPSNRSLGYRAQTRGLPLHSMWCKWESAGWGKGERILSASGIVLWQSTGKTSAYILPLRPLFPGFIINTLFYAIIIGLLWLAAHRMAPYTSRRLLRRRRGLCEKCAYPIGTSPVCTECGAAVRLQTPISSEDSK